MDNPHLYDLPLSWPIKSPGDIIASKRGMYRRRYAMLDTLASELGNRARATLVIQGVVGA